MNSQTLAGGIATAIGAMVVTYVVFVGAKPDVPTASRPTTATSPATPSPTIVPAQQPPAGKGPVVRDLPLE